MEPEVTTLKQAISLQTKKISQEIAYSKPTLSKNELKSVLECMIQDEISFGNVAIRYEKELASAFEYKYALTTSSISAAYHLAFLSFSVDEKSEIILASNTSVSALDAIGYLKANPVIVDIAPSSFHPSDEKIIEKINENTKVLILSYAYGSYRNYDKLKAFIKEKYEYIKIIEDISYIAGAENDEVLVGSLADIAIIGLHEDMLMTIGKGAAVLTNSQNIYSVIKDLRMHGGKKPYKIRYDYTITDYQAAMGLEQLSQLTNIINRRRKIGQLFKETLLSSIFETWFQYPNIDTFGAFPVICKQALEKSESFFKNKNIECRYTLMYGPLHRLTNKSASEFSNTEKLYQRGILLPLYPNLTKLNIERIITAIRSFH
ncbi:MAG: DegT/DnrJ/EryC1/StrS aminotransferase family protein [Spirochaetia bacterium]|nr:DegT/DnrJ/EryC1/StrS aminotransferase family protein [Spirochaetia bacterium]